MVTKEQYKEMIALVDELNNASQEYYCGVEELMSDRQFDIMENRLKELERRTGVVLPNSPTNNIGSDVVSSRKVQHEYQSLSLDKTKSHDEIAGWLGEHSGVMSWKYDGLTVILTYDDGRLVLAATRGDGTIGENVTGNVMFFKNIPTEIEDKRHIVFRGEAVVSYPTFDRINKSLPDNKQYKNPRNMAAGAMRFLDVKQTEAYSVELKVFDIANALELGLEKMSDVFVFAEQLGLPVVEWCEVNSENVARIIEQKQKEIEKLQYPSDGLVVVYNDLHIHTALGSTRKYPRYAKAFKWPDKMKRTILRDVDWSVAKSGLLSPIAVFDPVELEGTTVKRANVHNISIIRELGLGIGDHINVYKANMIIPQVYEDIEKTNNIIIPVKCPLCNSTLERRIGVNNKSVFLYCINSDCPAKK